MKPKQTELPAALLRPEAWAAMGQVTSGPTLIAETHISYIFGVGLGGEEFAFKVAKAVDIGVADFTTEAKRYLALMDEMEANRTMAKALYVKVVRIVRSPKGELLMASRKGRTADWALQMRRFQEKDLLSNMCAAGELSREHVNTLVDKIARAHLSASPVEGFGWAGHVGKTARANIRQLKKLKADDLLPGIVEAYAGAVKHATLGALRGREGRVRHCHGDLHLGNVVMLDGEPTPFDAIGFNERLATMDTMADFAFLLMDLLYRDQPELASAALNHYLDITGDYAGLPVLKLYMADRAMVRAMVILMAMEDAASRKRAMDYLHLAHSLMREETPYMVAIGGLSGSGKSTVARSLSQDLVGHMLPVVVRSDVLRKQIWGVKNLTDHLPPEGYSPEMTARTVDAARQAARFALKGGLPVIMDATFRDSSARRRVAAIATGMKVPFLGLWCHVAPVEVVRRIRERLKRGEDVSDATEDVYRMQLSGFRLQDVKTEEGWQVISGEGAPDKVANRAGKAVANLIFSEVVPKQ